MKHWVSELRRRLLESPRVVRVLLEQARGSTPREAGAVMLVDAQGAFGTIGGGELEWRALAVARAMIAPGGAEVHRERWPLGPELGQCCGGSVDVWFERFGPNDDALLAELEARLAGGETGWLVSRAHGEGTRLRTWSARPPSAPEADVRVERLGEPCAPVWIFGAGHVGRALAAVLEPLPFQITVVDSRASALDALPAGPTRRVQADDPAARVADAPAGAVLLVMTHSHEIDYSIVRTALARDDLAWVGLIGSETKATCFRVRLGRDAIDDSRVAALVSPIGVGGVRSKLPAAIAVAVAAQLLQRRAPAQ